MLSVVGNLLVDTLVDQNSNISSVPVDLLRINREFYQLRNGFNAADLNKIIQKHLDRLPDDTRPTWEVRFFILFTFYFMVKISLSV
jgi:hypothetical protein